MPKTFRTTIHSRRLEVRVGDLGGESVLLDGAVVGSRPFAGFMSGVSHRFELTDEKGSPRRVEVRVLAAKLGLSLRMSVQVDGQERGPFDPAAELANGSVCANCGYDLARLEAVNGETQCPECGRHTPLP